MFVELILVIFVGCALFAVFFPILFFVVQFLKHGLDRAFDDYMEYKYTQAVLNNANMHDEQKK
jgi:hypothetical protein